MTGLTKLGVIDCLNGLKSKEFSAVENVVKPMFLLKIQPSDLKIRRLEYLCCIIMPL